MFTLPTKAGILLILTSMTRPPSTLASMLMRPPGASSLKLVAGSVMGSSPVSRRAVTTQMVLWPENRG